MPDRKDKPRSKVLQSWTEIKDLSKHIQPGDPVTASKRESDLAAVARGHRIIEKTAPREDMQRAGRRKARQYEEAASRMAMQRASTLVNTARERKRKAEKGED
jgi:hypothetical protein